MVCLCMLCSCAVCIYINFTDIIIRQMATQQFMCIKQKKYLQQTNVEQIDMHELRIRLSGCKNNKNNNIFSLSISNTHTHTYTPVRYKRTKYMSCSVKIIRLCRSNCFVTSEAILTGHDKDSVRWSRTGTHTEIVSSIGMYYHSTGDKVTYCQSRQIALSILRANTNVVIKMK